MCWSSEITGAIAVMPTIPQLLFFLKGVVTLREVATTFDQGAHHPTMLVVLQALVAIIGEVKSVHRQVLNSLKSVHRQVLNSAFLQGVLHSSY